MDHGYGRWVFGGLMGLLALFGLFMASRAADGAFYWTGLAFFLFGVLVIFSLIGRAYGPPPPRRRRGSEEAEAPH